MKLHIAKWGNSLAVRLPAEYLRAASLREGDDVIAVILDSGEITLTPSRNFDKAVFLKQTRKFRASMPTTSSTVELMREAERY